MERLKDRRYGCSVLRVQKKPEISSGESSILRNSKKSILKVFSLLKTFFLCLNKQKLYKSAKN